jgi:hypothetical protein
MRKATQLSALVALNFTTASLGIPLTGEGGKFSISNIGPILFVALAGVFYFARRRSVDLRVVGGLLAFNITCVASFWIFLVQYSWDPNFAVLFFQDVELVFCLLLWWYGKEEPESFRKAVRVGIYLAFPILATYGWRDALTGGTWTAFGMDDKSQGAVLMCCEAYILIRYFGGRMDRVLGIVIYVMSFLTVSRLPVFFFPPIVLALMRGSRFAPVITIAGAALAIAGFVVAGDAIRDVFVLYDRVSSMAAVAQEDSTTAHLVLIKTALQMKFSDAGAFFFGIGPGNFSKALISFPISLTELEAVDPEFIAFAREGRAPLHSMFLQFLLDYSVVVFLVFVYALMKMFRFLMRRRNYADLTFPAAVLLSSTFYSLHNKPYFFLVSASVAVLISNEISAAVRSRARPEQDDPLTLAAPAGQEPVP